MDEDITESVSISPEDIEYEFSLKSSPDEDLVNYVMNFEGLARVWDEKLLSERTIGEIHGVRIDLASAIHDGFHHSDILEQISSEVSDFAEIVLNNKECLIPKTDNSNEKEECGCLVYISELKVDTELRGHGIGTMLFRRIPNMIDITDCLLALKAFPLTDEYGKVSEPEKVEKIKRFYEKLGFEHVGGEFMAKDARQCEAMKKRLAGRGKK